MAYKFALVGNPNCGKTTMFNEVTGSTQYVGNWPGVTVEKKEGRAKGYKEDVRVIDLPGIYSLSPYSLEEVIARNYIIDEKPDVVINIVDGSNIERNLYLTVQLLELGVPVIVALNMMDAVAAKGDKIDLKKLSQKLGVAVVPTSASRGQGIKDMMEKALEVAQTAAAGNITVDTMVFDDKIEQCLGKVQSLIKEFSEKEKYNLRWLALKVLEGDEKIKGKLNLSVTISQDVEPYIEKLEKEYDNDIETIIADSRYQYIEKIVGAVVKKKNESKTLTLSDKIDKIVTNRIFALPIFLFVMYAIFEITFGAIGSFTIDWVDVLINETIAGSISGWLEAAEAAEWLHALVVNGIIAGMGSMLVFVPQIMILFFFLSLLEDSGYMARAAFIMDRLLRKLGLSGKSFIPMIMGFGCSVPGVMAARTLENEKDRKLTIILTPFMSCGARLPVYALFTAAFFAQNQSLVIYSIYILGVAVAILSGIVLKNTILKGETAPFVMELPPYRFPTVKGIAIHMADRAKGFIKKAGTIIFAASVVIWFCQTFNFSLQMVEEPAESIFGVIGQMIAPVFAPIGFGDWQSSVALLTGLVAKEVVVATLGILHGLGEVAEDSAELHTALQNFYTPLKAYAFMAFTLLYVPCIAAVGAMKRELNSWKWTLFAIGYQTGVAWIVAFLIFQVGKLIGLE